MSKSKNHTAHNQNKKCHKNGIKKEKVYKYTSRKGVRRVVVSLCPVPSASPPGVHLHASNAMGANRYIDMVTVVLKHSWDIMSVDPFWIDRLKPHTLLTSSNNLIMRRQHHQK
eukprot:gene7298-413_t